MKHKKVVEQWYEIDFNTSHRYLGEKIDEFLSGSPELNPDASIAQEMWQDSHEVLRDYEGDFSGIMIYHTDDSAPIIRFICEKINVNYEDVKDLNFKLIG